MIQLIVGDKGKGKTKHLLEHVNNAVSTTTGNIVYLDKNSKHMYELKNKIRLINASEYPLESTPEFLGFVCGIVSQDHDLSQMYFDSFLDVAFVKSHDEIEQLVKKLEKISNQFTVDFVISMSVNESELSDYLKAMVIVSL
ncbi:MAG TPA: twitching motility protein PilT [Lachnospiraceae bacterium]|nr:twitching motility protein PilT [Lachnospiraceae bacterium]